MHVNCWLQLQAAIALLEKGEVPSANHKLAEILESEKKEQRKRDALINAIYKHLSISVTENRAAAKQKTAKPKGAADSTGWNLVGREKPNFKTCEVTDPAKLHFKNAEDENEVLPFGPYDEVIKARLGVACADTAQLRRAIEAKEELSAAGSH